MKVYRIVQDVEHYQHFFTEREEEEVLLEMDCTRKLGIWSPPEVFVLYPLLKAGDFYQVNGSLLIASRRATEILRDHFEAAGELLPLPAQGQEFTLLNVTECLNCLDHDRTEWIIDQVTGGKARPAKYAFRKDRFTESTIFKIPETRQGEVLVVDGLKRPEEEFRYMVQDAGLEGLMFEELWSDET